MNYPESLSICCCFGPHAGSLPANTYRNYSSVCMPIYVCPIICMLFYMGFSCFIYVILYTYIYVQIYMVIFCTHIPTYLPTYLPSYLPSTYLPTDLPTYTHTGHDIRWDPLDILSIDPFFVSLEVPQRLQSCKLRPSFNAAPIGSLGPRVTTRVSQRAEELFPWPFGVQRRKNIGRYCIYGWDKTAIPKWKLYG